MDATNFNNPRKFSPIHHTGHFLLLFVGVNLLIVLSLSVFFYYSLSDEALQQKELIITNECIENCKNNDKFISESDTRWSSVDDFCNSRCERAYSARHEIVKAAFIVIMLAMLNTAVLSLYGGLVRLFYNRRSGTALVILGFFLFLFFFLASLIL